MSLAMDLAEQIWRVVNSPYPVSLKPLEDATASAGYRALELWAAAHPCAVDPLVRAVIEGLETSPDALRLLEKYAHVASIRCAVLRQKPTLLDVLLRRASSCRQDAAPASTTEAPACTGNSWSLLSSVCVGLLSEDLPDGLAYPSSLASFLRRIVDAAMASPCVATFRPIYALLQCRPLACVELLPMDINPRFIEHLCEVMKCPENQALCLGIYARLASASRKAADSPLVSCSADRSESLQLQVPGSLHTSRLIEEFFTGKRAPKTVQLMVLNVIYACSESSRSSAEDAIESVSLAIQIISTVASAVRADWVRSSPKVMQKLYEKATKLGLPMELQLKALEFIYRLTGSAAVPPRIIPVFQDLVAPHEKPAKHIAEILHVSFNTMEGYMSRATSDFIYMVVQSALGACVQHGRRSDEDFHNIRHLSFLIRALTRSIQVSSTSAAPVESALSTKDISVTVKKFADSSHANSEFPAATCDGRNVCSFVFFEAHRNLCISVCSLLLLAAYSTSSDQPRIEQETIFLLLQKQQRLTSCPVVCHKDYPSRGTPPYIETVSILEQKSTPEHPSISHDWRERLTRDLSRDSSHMQDLIIKKFGAVCRDLEERCNVAEAPLREEQSRTAALTVECQAAQDRILQLESELRDFEARLESSNTEGARLKAEANTLTADIETAESEVQGLELRLQETCRDRDARLAVATERAKMQEMEHQAALALKDESIEELYDATKGLEKTVEEQTSAIALAEQKLEQARGTIGALEAKTSEYEQEIAQQHALAAANRQKIDGLEESRSTLQRNVDTLTEDLRSSESTCATLRAQLTEREESLRKETSEFARDRDLHRRETEAKDAHITRLESEVHELETKLRNDHQSMVLERKQKDMHMRTLDAKIKHLQDERAAKAKEFTEVQEISRRLMALIGTSSASIALSSSASHTQASPEQQIRVPASQFAPEAAGRSCRRTNHDAAWTEDGAAATQSPAPPTASAAVPTVKRHKPVRASKPPRTPIATASKKSRATRLPQAGASRPALRESTRANTQPPVQSPLYQTPKRAASAAVGGDSPHKHSAYSLSDDDTMDLENPSFSDIHIFGGAQAQTGFGNAGDDSETTFD